MGAAAWVNRPDYRHGCRQAGRSRDDYPVHTLAGAIIGVLTSAEFHWVEHPDSDLPTLLDEALAHLKSGQLR
ncbi:MAG TPA: hypothetical protein VMI33_26315 [Streptosporangiaceae bacterium]|nr:hypothetical protein [Streptosporangiaceae bacterium]